MTPGAVSNAIETYRLEHKLGVIILTAFAIRLAQIYAFTWLWWKTRPNDPDKPAVSVDK